MKTHQEQDNAPKVIQQKGNKQASAFKDGRSETVMQTKLYDMVNNSEQVTQMQSLQRMADNRVQNNPFAPIQRKENNTGLPDNLKSGIENLSGYSMNDVKVHYNSDKPAQLQAHAYAQGTDIHVASGQEKHLPHEAWHVVQQKQDRVKPTMQMKGKVNVNNDSGLEREADVMGAKALSQKSISKPKENSPSQLKTSSNNGVAQRIPFSLGDTIYDSEDCTLKELRAYSARARANNDDRSWNAIENAIAEGYYMSAKDEKKNNKRGAEDPTRERGNKFYLETLRTARKPITNLTTLLKKGRKASAAKEIGTGLLDIAAQVAVLLVGIPGLNETFSFGAQGLTTGGQGLTTAFSSLSQFGEYAGQKAITTAVGIGEDVATAKGAKEESKLSNNKTVNTRRGKAVTLIPKEIRDGAKSVGTKKGREKLKQKSKTKIAMNVASGVGELVAKPLMNIGRGVGKIVPEGKARWRKQKQKYALQAMAIIDSIQSVLAKAEEFYETQDEYITGKKRHVAKDITGFLFLKKTTLKKEIDALQKSINKAREAAAVYVDGDKS